MSLRPYKFLVQAVVQELDDDGRVTAERASDPATVFGVDGLARWAGEFEEQLSVATSDESP